ncbi:MAG TPA: DUF3617 family protein [Desulfuromonadales bacterium]|nr:DUF3617 family protein [Desulfuromonadales bacterium]
MKIALRIFIATAAVAIPLSCFAAPAMKDGQWEITTVMDMPNMPVKIPPQVMKHCYSKDDVKDQKKVINRDKNCTVKDYSISGNRVTWKMECTGENAGTMSGETVFGSDSYDSTMKMVTKGRNMNMKVKAKRVGNCP